MPRSPAAPPSDPAKLHGAKLRATRARLLLLATIRRAKHPLAAPELVTRLRAHINTATVYRTLRALEEMRLIRRVNFEHDHAHYELTELGDHHHLVCVQCDRVEEITCTGLDALTRRVLAQSRAFASIDRHALELFGRCRTCTKRRHA